MWNLYGSINLRKKWRVNAPLILLSEILTEEEKTNTWNRQNEPNLAQTRQEQVRKLTISKEVKTTGQAELELVEKDVQEEPTYC